MKTRLLSEKAPFLTVGLLVASSLVVLSAAWGLSRLPNREGQYEAQFTDDGALVRPEGWREWVYIGAPLTPNGLNGGEASFPEFHSVYIDPKSWTVWQETGEFRDGAMIAKELVLTITEEAHEDGSIDQPSGRGYFMSEFQGYEIALKDSERFPDEPGNWAYFSFGHVAAEDYSESAEAMPQEACNSCHEQFADDDWVFTQFYPVLTAAKP